MSNEPSVEVLLAHHTTHYCGRDTFVTMPEEYYALPEDKKAKVRTQILRELQERRPAPTLDTAALHTALERLNSAMTTTSSGVRDRFNSPSPTPSLHSEDVTEEIESNRRVEEDARAALIRHGCPPCYPSTLQPPFENLPERYQGIVTYFASKATGTPLWAQCREWEGFLLWRRRNRHLFKHHFCAWQVKVRDSRRKAGLVGEYPLYLDVEQRDRIGTWVEYQFFHLRRTDRLQRELEKERRGVLAAQGRLATIASDSEAARKLDIYEYRVVSALRRLDEDVVLVKWIEEQRVAMVAGQGEEPHKRSRNYLPTRADEAHGGCVSVSRKRKCSAIDNGPTIKRYKAGAAFPNDVASISSVDLVTARTRGNEIVQTKRHASEFSQQT